MFSFFYGAVLCPKVNKPLPIWNHLLGKFSNPLASRYAAFAIPLNSSGAQKKKKERENYVSSVVLTYNNNIYLLFPPGMIDQTLFPISTQRHGTALSTSPAVQLNAAADKPNDVSACLCGAHVRRVAAVNNNIKIIC